MNTIVVYQEGFLQMVLQILLLTEIIKNTEFTLNHVMLGVITCGITGLFLLPLTVQHPS